jgi:peptidylprolyl isomerase domain and WD repeat-containing protein 1
MDSDDEFGPAPAAEEPMGADSGNAAKQVPAKKKRRLENESVYLASLPSATAYEKSYMHRDVITHIVIARDEDFILTGSIDGHIKLWKKMSTGIEFVKHFVAHIGKLHCLQISGDGKKLVSSGADRMIKIFEIASFDMINIIRTPVDATDSFTPGVTTWLVERTSNVYSRIATADTTSGSIRVYNADAASNVFTTLSIHMAPIVAMCLVSSLKFVISVDTKVRLTTILYSADANIIL